MGDPRNDGNIRGTCSRGLSRIFSRVFVSFLALNTSFVVFIVPAAISRISVPEVNGELSLMLIPSSFISPFSLFQVSIWTPEIYLTLFSEMSRSSVWAGLYTQGISGSQVSKFE